MADDPNPKGEPAKDDPPTNPDKPELGDAGKKALDDERKARREAEKALKEVQAKLKEIEDKDKSEVDKLREENEKLKTDLADTGTRADRLQVAIDKGLTPAQAKRLVGSTLDELAADADEILEAFPSPGGKTPPPSRTPTPDMKGGSDPTNEPVDVKALVDSIPPTA